MEKLIALLVVFHNDSPFIFWCWLFILILSLFFIIVGSLV